MADEQEIGSVIHYYNKISVAVIRLTSGGLKVGDTIHIQGNSTDFIQEVESMQIEHQGVSKAKKADEFGLKVDKSVHEGDRVYLVA